MVVAAVSSAGTAELASSRRTGGMGIVGSCGDGER